MANKGQVGDIGWGITVGWQGDTYALISFDGPGEEADSVETSHSQTTNKWKTFIAGMLDAGEFSIECNFKASEKPVVGASGTLTINFPGPNTFTCAAFLMSAPSSGQVDDRMTANLTWKLTGEPTWA